MSPSDRSSAARATKRNLRLADPPPDPQVAVAPHPRGRSRLLRIGTVMLSLFALLLLFGLVAFNALLVRHQGRIDELDRELEAAARANQQLRFDVAELEAPERIREHALSVLGMTEPEVVVYLEPLQVDERGGLDTDPEVTEP